MYKNKRQALPEERVHLHLTQFEAKALRNQLRSLPDPPPVIGKVLEAIAGGLEDVQA